ncbi:MAG: pseudouridine synthase [Andreesenia angusta]|nr:pseudouridine synthase [Andreesenia angusta]
MAKKQRIDKILGNMGYGSRKELKKIAKTGAIRVNGKPIKDSSTKVDPDEEEIYFYDEEVIAREYIYLMLNKPKGFISATEDYLHDTVLDLIDQNYLIFDIFPVGRLDKDTEGLLILSNDGQFAHNILSPKKNIKKKYYAIIDGRVNEEDIELFEEGIVLDDGYQTLPADLKIIKSGRNSEIELIITEGKYHQVKRMFEAIDKKVIYLKRLSIGGLNLDKNLELGEYRELNEEEIKNIMTNKI